MIAIWKDPPETVARWWADFDDIRSETPSFELTKAGEQSPMLPVRLLAKRVAASRADTLDEIPSSVSAPVLSERLAGFCSGLLGNEIRSHETIVTFKGREERRFRLITPTRHARIIDTDASTGVGWMLPGECISRIKALKLLSFRSDLPMIFRDPLFKRIVFINKIVADQIQGSDLRHKLNFMSIDQYNEFRAKYPV